MPHAIFHKAARGAVALDCHHIDSGVAGLAGAEFALSSILIAVAWLVLVCALAPAHAETRATAVIGNGAHPLKNAPNGARDFADVLKKLDFGSI